MFSNVRTARIAIKSTLLFTILLTKISLTTQQREASNPSISAGLVKLLTEGSVKNIYNTYVSSITNTIRNQQSYWPVPSLDRFTGTVAKLMQSTLNNAVDGILGIVRNAINNMKMNTIKTKSGNVSDIGSIRRVGNLKIDQSVSNFTFTLWLTWEELLVYYDSVFVTGPVAVKNNVFRTVFGLWINAEEMCQIGLLSLEAETLSGFEPDLGGTGFMNVLAKSGLERNLGRIKSTVNNELAEIRKQFSINCFQTVTGIFQETWERIAQVVNASLLSELETKGR